MQGILNGGKWRISVVDQKIYAEQVVGEDIRQSLRTMLNSDIDAPLGDSHVTIVTSGPMKDLEIKRPGAQNTITRMLPHETFGLTYQSIASTFSLDWEPCSFCFVVRVSSPEIEEFVVRFNAEFSGELKQPLRPSLHITYGCVRRGV